MMSFENFVRKHFGWVMLAAMLLATAMLPMQAKAAETAGRIKLIFSFDQSFGNGLVVQRDLVGTQRIIDALKPLKQRYDVYLLLEPQVRKKENLEAILDLMVENDQPFVFDLFSSDAMAMGASPQNKSGGDMIHGAELSLTELSNYKKRYGKYLAGGRLMEIFGQDYSIYGIKTDYPEWRGSTWSALPADGDFMFDPDLVRLYLHFAKEHEMFIEWSDFNWFFTDFWSAPLTRQYRQDVLGLLEDYREIITVTYANNEPVRGSLKTLGTWRDKMEPVAPAKSGLQLGLSNQSWIYSDDPMGTPVQLLIDWNKSAFGHGCRLIQYEPVWYWFNLPGGTMSEDATSDYTKDPAWATRGEPRPAFHELMRSLLEHAEPAK